jgi:hypothetical protein
MKEREVPKELQSKARKYIEFINSQSSHNNNITQTALVQLNENLKNEI